jgi:hypothetical protein
MSAPNAMVAAARRITDARDVKRLRKHAMAWQDRCWEHYDTCGEYRYAVDWMGAMLSKAVLYIADADGNKVTEGLPVDLLASLFGGGKKQGGMLGGIGVHWTVAGDCYLVGTTSEAGKDEWQIVAGSSLTARGGKFYIDSEEVLSKDQVFVCRLWRPHPRKRVEANSPSRAVLPILGEIEGLTKRVAAEIDSRLTGAGLTLLPDNITFPTTPVTEGQETQVAANDADRFVQFLQEVMSEAIAHPESASATVPFAVTMPAESIQAVRHLTFWSPLDEHSIELRKEAIGRLALGMDMPPEVLTGLADLNHWNAWAVDDAGIKAHAEPLLDLITDALTDGYLFPLLVDAGTDPVTAAQWSIAADTSGIRLRPNRSKEAFELYDRGELSAEALRRETGFEETDAPDESELREWYIRKVASGSTTPELVAQALALLGVQVAVATEDPTTEERPTPSLTEHPVHDAPEMPLAEVASAAPSAALLAASEQMVFRALERAGNRIKTRAGTKPPGVSAMDLYQYVPLDLASINDVLTDAWGNVERACPSLGVAPGPLTNALDSYCRVLLSERKPHDPSLLASYLTLVAAAT